MESEIKVINQFYKPLREEFEFYLNEQQIGTEFTQRVYRQEVEKYQKMIQEQHKDDVLLIHQMIVLDSTDLERTFEENDLARQRIAHYFEYLYTAQKEKLKERVGLRMRELVAQ